MGAPTQMQRRRGRRRQRRYRQLLSVGRAATATVAFSDALAFSRRREPEPRPVAATREGRHALLPCVYVVAIGCVIRQRRQRWPKRRGRRRSRRNGGDGGRGPSSVAESAAVRGWRRWGGARLASERVGGSASRHGNSGRRRLPCTPLLLRRGRLPPRSESPLGLLHRSVGQRVAPCRTHHPGVGGQAGVGGKHALRGGHVPGEVLGRRRRGHILGPHQLHAGVAAGQVRRAGSLDERRCSA
mmetsp:Transcript_30253/g.48693  ORF Transcript_30253/g.48693 Transcript_30253/m.48693 type:complete len:242 (+) Transcript_30253:192-917(+)